MLKVYYADISQFDFNERNLDDFAYARINYVNSFTDKNKRSQSIAVWALLLYALKSCNVNFNDADFKQNEFGKWFLTSGGVYFSLSHSGNIVTVVVSDFNVGVDVETCSPKILQMEKKLADDGVAELDVKEKIFQLTKLWTVKEAVFKCGETKKLSSFFISCNGGYDYALTVVSSENCKNIIKINSKNIFSKQE